MNTINKFALLLGTSCLGACGSDKKEDPKPTYVISVHITGVNAPREQTSAFIDTKYDFADVRNMYKQGKQIRETYTTATVDKTYELGTFGDYDLVEVEMSRPPRTFMASGSFLKTDILVNGVVRATATMCNCSASRTTVAVETDNL